MRSKLGLFAGFCGVACGQFRIPLHAQDAGRVLPVRRPFTSRAWRRDPQHFHCARTGLVPFCTSDPHAYAHSPVSSPVAGLAARSRSARRGLRDMPAMPDARTRRGWDRGVDGIAQEGTDARRRFTGQAARVSTGCVRVMLILRRGPLERPGRSLSGLRYPSHELERDAAAPSNARFRSRSRTSPVPGHNCGPSRWRISGGASRDIRAGQNQARPLHV